MEQYGIRPYWILDYGNDCYPTAPGSPSQSCDTAACITAFGNYASAVGARYKGHNITFERLNEPDGMGVDNATDITALCQAAGVHFQAAGEQFVGPTTAGMNWAYLNQTFGRGILGAFTGVSVHPYRDNAPESVFDDWQTLRALIAQYTPPGTPALPMISGEWGYDTSVSSVPGLFNVDESLQGQYMARMWLTNVMCGVNTSMAFDWRDDGNNLTSCGLNFGSVYATSHTTCAAGVPVTDRLDCGDYGVTHDECTQRGCCWQTIVGPDCYYAVVPLPSVAVSFPVAPAAAGSCWSAVDTFGNTLPQVCADASGKVTLTATQAPVYLL